MTSEGEAKITSNGVDKSYEFVKVHWGYELSELYKLVVKFFKEQSGKALQLTYSERCHLVALSQQVTHGPYDAKNTSSQNFGFMDVVGRDRRLAWQSLGDISADEARLKFVEEVHRVAPPLKPYIEACYADHVHQQQKLREKEEEEQRLKLEQDMKELELKQEQEEQKQQEQTKIQIQTALNQQTFAQFKVYSEHQFPDNPEQQGVLVRQLQEQHYQQYMQQVYQQQLQKQQHQAFMDQQVLQNGGAEIVRETKKSKDTSEGEEETSEDIKENGDGTYEGSEAEGSNVAAAALWTRRDIKEFKASVQKEGASTILKVGHGETVTVRVPTHADGSCLFWEFATDAYDIAFGLYFEWTDESDTNGVTVHVTESEDEEESEGDSEEEEKDEDEESDEFDGDDDIERGIAAAEPKAPSPPQTVIVPVYRRDSHDEVYAGSHSYPGTGVYLLKFDNSYSLWRSKTLYYRVYYSQ